jgi:hypothetical protein
MIKKAKSFLYGIKGTTQTQNKISKKNKTGAEPQSRIDICLNCTKPASECKGNCFGQKL